MFLSKKCRRNRAIAKADGIFLYGEDLVKQENLKAGLLLAVTLYDDIIEIINGVIKWMDENPHSTPFEIAAKSRWLAKRFIDFIYGVAMSNKPQYTSSRLERINRIKEVFPHLDRMMETLLNITKNGVGDFDNLRNMIEGLRPNAEKNLQKLLDEEKNIEQQGTK